MRAAARWKHSDSMQALVMTLKQHSSSELIDTILPRTPRMLRNLTSQCHNFAQVHRRQAPVLLRAGAG